ncbi:hypothetical protein ACFSJU_14695 [Paradesertivirga mongoliensis]|uniref:Uncharacterized protein n=1 Tax=Paradesertivirga mongoliensis TaxID=2100740 RepID=A0ABW4ZP03_9SPHI|nr:hypothetical protein [Pedobacter mongoliensis]
MAKSRTDVESVVKLVINGQQAKTEMKEISNSIRKYESEIIRMKKADNPKAYQEKAQAIATMKQALNAAKKEMSGMTEESKKFGTSWKTIAAGVVGANVFQNIAGSAMSAIVRIKDAYGEAQKFRAILTNAFNGDGSKANNALKMLNDFAAKTPFSLASATESYIKLVNRGIVPTQQELIKMGDLAASQGKELNMFVEAILDAQTGENERLKEFGIQASKNGDKVSFTFKGITKEVDNTAEAINKALVSFGEMEGVSGTMEAVSKTIVGLQSNIGDSWDQIFAKLGSKGEGFIYGFFKTYADALDFVNTKLLSTESASMQLTREWAKNAEQSVNLEKKLNPLIDRHDQLKAKTKLNKDEQVELKKVIGGIAAIMPSAVTQWDNLGNAISVNTTKAKQFIEIQKAVLKEQNKDALAKHIKETNALYRERYRLTTALNSAPVVDGKRGTKGALELGGNKVTMTPEVQQAALDRLKKVNAEIEKNKLIRMNLEGWQYDNILNMDEVKPSGGTDAGGGGTKDKNAKAEKEANQLQTILDRMDDAYKAATAKRLEGFAAEEQAITNKYDKERREAEQYLTDSAKLSAALASIKKAETAEMEALSKKIKAENEKEQDDQLKKAQKEYADFLKKEADTQQKIFELGMDARQKEQLAVDDQFEKLIIAADEVGADTTLIYEKWIEAKSAIEDKYLEKSQEKVIEAEAKKNEAMLQAASQISNDVFAIMSNSRTAQTDAAIADLERQREAELSNKNLSDKQKEAINAKYDEKIKSERRKAWQAEQKAAIAQAVINGALAMTKVSAQTGVLTFAFSPIVAALTAAQVAVIASQKAPQFAKGGFVPDGPSHQRGGIKMIDSITGAMVGEMEGGEPIISRETYANNPELVDALLYSGQRKNGARLSIDMGAMQQAERMYRNGGVSPVGSSSLPVASKAQNPQAANNLDELKGMMAEMMTAIRIVDEKPTVFSTMLFEEHNKRIMQVRQDAGA